MKIQRIKNQCNLCMLCVREYVSGSWRVIEGEPAMAAPGLCNRCGHCVAVCPQSAIYHEALDYTQIVETRRNGDRSKAYEDVVRSRRSIRQYTDNPVPAEMIEKLLYLSSHSPTASNKQNVAYSVITDKRMLRDVSRRIFGFSAGLYRHTREGLGNRLYRGLKWLSPDTVSRYLDPMDYYIAQSKLGRDYILHEAPVLILIHGPKNGSFINENCNIAATNLMNADHASGLGTCYIGFLVLALKWSFSVRKLVKVPKGRKVYAALVMGYPAYRHRFTSSRKKPEITWINAHD